jgi:hypothetical protein
MTGNKNTQPTLRLVTREGRFELPRRYAQSTSGRVSSTGTLPPLSRSSDMERASRKRSPVDKALRRYPMEVPQRLAYDSCSAGSNELRYERSDSMDCTLPTGKELSIPMGHLPDGKAVYAVLMADDNFLAALYATRRQRLAELVGKRTHVAFVHDVSERLNVRPELQPFLKSFMTANYVSRALNAKQPSEGGKNIGEEAAWALEKLFDRTSGWMSLPDSKFAELPWPFPFSRKKWDSLDDEQRRKAAESFEIAIDGVLSRGAPPQKRLSKKP